MQALGTLPLQPGACHPQSDTSCHLTPLSGDGGWLVQPSQASLLPASAPTRSRWMNGAQDVDLCQRLYSGPESESSSLAGGPTVHMGIANPGDEEEPSSN